MDYHAGSREERQTATAKIPDEWTFDTLLDLLGGLLDHGYQVSETARERLLEIACLPNIKPLVIHPKDLAFRYILPGTHDNTFALVRKMKEIGLPAEEICENFFKCLVGGSKRKIRQALEILEGSPLYETSKKQVREYLKNIYGHSTGPDEEVKEK